jgi:hypothetical protein
MGELLVRFSYALRKDELAEVLDVLVMTGQVVLKANKYTYIPRPEE